MIPKIENLQVLGFSQGKDIHTVFRNFLKNNKCLLETTFDEVIAMELKSEKKKYFSLESLRAKNLSINND